MQTIIVASNFFNVKDETVFAQQNTNVVKRNLGDYESANLQEYTKTNNTNTKTVKFYDDNKQTSVSLSSEAVDLLYSHFSKSDFMQLSDGSIGLSGEANAYVEGWFKDIAYSRDFIKSDTNNNGKIDKNELMNVKNFARHSNENQDIEVEFVMRMSQNAAGYKTGFEVLDFVNQEGAFKQTSISDELNKTIKSDKNFDGKLGYLEYQSRGESLKQGVSNWVDDALHTYLSDNRRKSITGLIVDFDGSIMKNMNGKTVDEIAAFAASRFGGLSANGGLNSSIDESTTVLKNKRLNKDEKELEALKIAYPEFENFISNNKNVSEDMLRLMKIKKKNDNKRAEFIQRNFVTNGEIDLQKFNDFREFNAKFTLSMLKVDTLV